MAMKDQLSVKMPTELLKEIDQEMELSGYSSRSELIKAATRHYLDFLYQKRKDRERWEDSPIGEKREFEGTGEGRV